MRHLAAHRSCDDGISFVMLTLHQIPVLLMKLLISLSLCVSCSVVLAQKRGHLVLQGNFSKEDSVHIVSSYVQARNAVAQMYTAMLAIRDATPGQGETKKSIRAGQWINDEAFTKWLGRPENMRLVFRNIRKIHHKFDSKFIFEVVKVDEGRCNRFVGAWAVPYGRMKIRLCRNFLNMPVDHGAKILIHEVGHETGILFHQDLFSCRAVLRAAASHDMKARRSPETYAWLAMSYEGLDCFSQWGY